MRMRVPGLILIINKLKNFLPLLSISTGAVRINIKSNYFNN